MLFSCCYQQDSHLCYTVIAWHTQYNMTDQRQALGKADHLIACPWLIRECPSPSIITCYQPVSRSHRPSFSLLSLCYQLTIYAGCYLLTKHPCRNTEYTQPFSCPGNAPVFRFAAFNLCRRVSYRPKRKPPLNGRILISYSASLYLFPVPLL